SAGVTAGMDLALAMVEEDHGRDLALRVAREMVMFLKRPGGQSQFSAHLAAQTAQRSVIREVQERILADLGADLSVPALAKAAGMSERNFARVFHAEARMTPAEFVEKSRIDAARRRMEESDVPLKRVADEVGYANVDGFRGAWASRRSSTGGASRPRSLRWRLRPPRWPDSLQERAAEWGAGANNESAGATSGPHVPDSLSMNDRHEDRPCHAAALRRARRLCHCSAHPGSEREDCLRRPVQRLDHHRLL